MTKLIITLLFLSLAFFILYKTIYAIEAVVSATVAPWYTIREDGNNLMIETNMQVYINNLEIK